MSPLWEMFQVGFTAIKDQNFKLFLFFFKILKHPAIFPYILFIYSLCLSSAGGSRHQEHPVDPTLKRGISKIGTQHHHLFSHISMIHTLERHASLQCSSIYRMLGLPSSRIIQRKIKKKHSAILAFFHAEKKMIDLCRIQRRKICGASVSNSLPLPFPFGSRKKRYGKLANIRLFSSKNEGFVCAFPEVTTTAEAEAKKSSQPTTGVEEKKNPSIL